MGRITLDKPLIKELSELLNDNNLSEISVTQGRLSVKIARNLTSGGAIVNHVTDKNISEIEDTENVSNHAGAVKSPMVGTVYLASSPEDKPFISVGQTVKEGDQLFIIEAMKTMNPVKSPFSGVVKQIIIKNEMPIEYDEVLAVIDIT
jgi:acetyl-CoA carboxylase biotin carboxyl carrier protein|tara:strand:+ start:202 stop:645 length:444 start_codon:yes stop_codon:yes gene_type:complete